MLIWQRIRSHKGEQWIGDLTVEIRAQRIISEVLFPESWGELRRILDRVPPVQDIDDVVLRVHTLQPAGTEQALDDA